MCRTQPGAVCLAVLLTALMPAALHAQTARERRQELSRQMDDIRDEVRRIDRDLAAIEKDLAAARADQQAARHKADAARQDQDAARQDAAARQRKLDGLRRDMAAATTRLTTLTRQLLADAERNPETVRLVQAYDAARQEMEQVRTEVLSPLREREAYKVAFAGHQQAQAQLEALRNQPDVLAETRVRLAAVAVERESVVKKLEQEVLDASAACAAVKLKLQDALQNLQDQRKKNEAAAADHPDALAIRKTIDGLRPAITAAQAELVAAARQQAVAEAAFAKVQADVDRHTARVHQIDARRRMQDGRKARREDDLKDLRRDYDRAR